MSITYDNFLGATLEYSYDYPFRNSEYDAPDSSTTFVVGDGVELTDLNDFDDNFDFTGDFGSIDVSDTSITITMNQFGEFSSGGLVYFNGIHLSDANGELSYILDVSVSTSTNWDFLEWTLTDRIDFDGDNIWIDFAGLAHFPGATITLDVQFADMPVAEDFRMPLGSGNLTQELDAEDAWYNANDVDDLLWSERRNTDVYHVGEDWNRNDGNDGNEPVYAASQGTVVFAGLDQTVSPGLNNDYPTGYGNVVIIEHLLPSGEKIYSLYAHLDSINVSVGQDIYTDNLVIGQVGMSGFADSDHLHFEMFSGDWEKAMLIHGYVENDQRLGFWQGEHVATYFDPSDFILGKAFDPEPAVVYEGGNGSQTIAGSASGDNIHGGGGGDDIFGLGGNDFLFGDRGRDYISGGDGNDVIEGNGGNDIIDGGFGSDEIYGGKNDDTINGGNGADIIFGGSGRDILNGGDENDILNGGRGADTFVFNLYSRNSVNNDVIEDFEDRRDTIRIDSGNFAQISFEDLIVTQDGVNTVVFYGYTVSDPDHPTGYESSITLLDFDSSLLSDTDFQFI